MMINYNEQFFFEFPPISTKEWKAKILADLKGVDFDKKLVWNTGEGFQVMPFYRSENIHSLNVIDALPGEFPYIRGTKKHNNWFVRQDLLVTNFYEANRKALELLEQGITSLGFKISSKEDINIRNISILLSDIPLQRIEINFSTCCIWAVDLIQIFLNYCKKNNFDLTGINGSINIDFIGNILTKGIIEKDWVLKIKEAFIASSELLLFRVLPVNAYLLSDAGSLITQELGYALAWGNELLSTLTKENIHVIDIANKIKFNFGIGSNFFLEIAKFRAARWLWAKIVNAYEEYCGNKHFDKFDKNQEKKWHNLFKMNVFAQTTIFNQTIFDPYVNLLRSQTEAMSASIAGIDSLLIRTFDETFRTPNDFSERISRNQQLLLKEESHFDKVVDVSGGSYYIETLTNSLALEAWKIFLEIEEIGFYKSVKSGKVQELVNNVAEKRFVALSQHNEILLGTNQFPNFIEKPEEKIEITQKINFSAIDQTVLSPVLNKKRLSEDFEMLRFQVKKACKEIKVFILPIGNLKIRLLRSQFACDFLACAGYTIIDSSGFETLNQGITSSRLSCANIIVLCSSDDEYTIYLPEVYNLLGNNEILIIVLDVFIPTYIVESIKGRDNVIVINKNSNVLEVLKNLNVVLGIE